MMALVEALPGTPRRRKHQFYDAILWDVALAPRQRAGWTRHRWRASVDSPAGDRLSLWTEHPVDWATICTRLQHDPNDQGAWDALVVRVRPWAHTRLRGRAPDLIEDAVADMCASVVLDIDAARGPETFKGFVLGKCPVSYTHLTLPTIYSV